ncbi:MAG: hypothetical protein HYZ14_18330 [Bacteroidetes bacterium]|nr:hypothetical protein [Bacteroidota bacterium]
MKSLFLLLVLAGCFAPVLYSQNNPSDTTKQQLFVVTKNDGTEYIGIILSDDGREILMQTEALGKIYIPKSEIRSIVKIEDRKEIVYGEYQATGPFTTRYAFTTNALPIVKGENYALINLYGPEVHFAVSNHFNIGIMSTWIASPMVLAMKYSFNTKNEKLNFSLGTLFGTSGYLNTFRGYGGLHFANMTFGDRKRNITFSAGYAYVQDGFYDAYITPGTYYTNTEYLDTYSTGNQLRPASGGPIFSVAGIITAGAKASFVFDSMLGIFSADRNTITTTTLTEPYYNPNPPYDYTPGLYQHVVADQKTGTAALFLMPGMRFQTKENRAFQISLAGVALFRYKGYSGPDKNTSFPVPMCTWFFRF